MPERSVFLTLGIVLTVIRSLGIMLFASLVGTIGVGMSGLVLFHDEPRHLLPFSVALGVGVLFVLGVLIYYGVTVVACVGAWRGSRGWTWTLLALSSLGLLHAGPFGLVIAALTIVGCVQALGGARDDREPGV